ncbi:MAG: hypothetical protein ACRCUE_17540 [Bosea sp. (in: a-proteobacteria)]
MDSLALKGFVKVLTDAAASTERHFMRGIVFTVAALAVMNISVPISPAMANGGFRPFHVTSGGAVSGRSFHAPVARLPRGVPSTIKPFFVPVSAGFFPVYGRRTQNLTVNTTVVINAPRPGIATVTELPVMMGIRRAPSADPVIHQVGRSFSVTSLHTHRSSGQRWRGPRDPGTGMPIQYQNSSSVSSSITVFRHY